TLPALLPARTCREPEASATETAGPSLTLPALLPALLPARTRPPLSLHEAEPAVAADGAGRTDSRGMKSFRPAPLLNFIVRGKRGTRMAVVRQVHDRLQPTWDETERLLLRLRDRPGTQVSLEVNDQAFFVVEYVEAFGYYLSGCGLSD